jgi:mono/diheme cytochrome c family protein
MQDALRIAVLGVSLLSCASQSEAASSDEGKALLERNCGRCHALAAGTRSPLDTAPNLWIVLQSYSSERLEFELAEGIGSRHRDMPQVQFTSEEIASIQSYLSEE